MADECKSSAGWNNSAALALLSPQPALAGILSAPWNYAVGGSASTLVDYTELTYEGSITPAQFSAICTALGVSPTTKTAQRTMRLVQNDRTTWANYNCNVHYPDLSGPGGRFKVAFYHDVKFIVQILGTAS